jgi:hypothetical protein
VRHWIGVAPAAAARTLAFAASPRRAQAVSFVDKQMQADSPLIQRTEVATMGRAALPAARPVVVQATVGRRRRSLSRRPRHTSPPGPLPVGPVDDAADLREHVFRQRLRPV